MPKQPKVIDLQQCLPENLLRVDPKTQELVNAPRAELKGKTVLLYFSAHWCFPCQTFTPQLAETYNALKKKDKDIEVVFISNDNHSGQFEIYFKYMLEEGANWLAVPFKECREERAWLQSDLNVLSIPCLVVVGPDGAVIAPNARYALVKDPMGENFPWEGAAASGTMAIWLTLAVFLFALVLNKWWTERGGGSI